MPASGLLLLRPAKIWPHIQVQSLCARRCVESVYALAPRPFMVAPALIYKTFELADFMPVDAQAFVKPPLPVGGFVIFTQNAVDHICDSIASGSSNIACVSSVCFIHGNLFCCAARGSRRGLCPRTRLATNYYSTAPFRRA
jgi:hypothetical protein